MKVLMLSGFLGAGKTSLLLQLADYLTGATDGHETVKVAILENEIGKVSVDGTTLKSQGIEVREIFSGCVCCTLTGELADTVQEIETCVSPEWLIVEATGLAYPARTADTIRQASATLDLLRTIVLINAENFLILDNIVPLISGQPQYADVLLLNKVDLVDDDTKHELIDRLREINPSAPLYEIIAADTIPSTLFEEVLQDVA
jgi:G3E family GTPase